MTNTMIETSNSPTPNTTNDHAVFNRWSVRNEKFVSEEAGQDVRGRKIVAIIVSCLLTSP